MFDPKKDKIAITIPKFDFLKNSEGLFMRKYNEPYIVSFAVDSMGKANPTIDFNLMPFYKVRPGSTVEMLGDGHLLYGPKNPGEFVAVSILMMECDDDVRKIGKDLKDFTKSKALDLGLKTLITANSGASAILGVLKELTTFAAGMLEKNKDDKLLTYEGTFLRDTTHPYHVNRRYSRKNDFVDLYVQVIPLESSNGQGKEVEKIVL